jgi:hypothetical protein
MLEGVRDEEETAVACSTVTESAGNGVVEIIELRSVKTTPLWIVKEGWALLDRLVPFSVMVDVKSSIVVRFLAAVR